MISGLTLLAIVLQLADAGQTCAALRMGGMESNARLGASPSCVKVFAFKGAALAPLMLPLSPKWRMAVQVGNIGSGSVGVGASVVLYWNRR